MNTWAHLHRDSHVALTIYSLCPIKQFSIAFLRSLGDVKITEIASVVEYDLLNTRTVGHPSTWHHMSTTQVTA